VVPVDHVCRGVVALSLRPGSRGKVFHFANPRPMPVGEAVTWCRKRGYALETVPLERWKRALLELSASAPGTGIEPYLPLIDEASEVNLLLHRFDCRETAQELARLGVRCPEVGGELLEKYIGFAREVGLVREGERAT